MDNETCELREDFYHRILSGEEGRTEALHNAQQALREKYSHPYYWSAFSCQGNPDPCGRFDGDRGKDDTFHSSLLESTNIPLPLSRQPGFC